MNFKKVLLEQKIEGPHIYYFQIWSNSIQDYSLNLLNFPLQYEYIQHFFDRLRNQITLSQYCYDESDLAETFSSEN